MKAAFDSHADSYREEVNRAIAFAGKDVEFYAKRKAGMLAELAVAHGGAPSASTILDVGCGIGLVDRHLVDAFGMVVGVDVSAAELELASSNVPRASYLLSKPERIPQPDCRFDVAFAANVLHHTPQHLRPSLVAEMARTVRPAGLIVVFEHNPRNPLTRWVVRRISFDEGVVLLPARAVVELFRSAGIGETEVRHMTFLPFATRFADTIERRLMRVPFGAQYAVVGHKPPT